MGLSMTQVAANDYFHKQMDYFEDIRNSEGLNTTWSILEVDDVFSIVASDSNWPSDVNVLPSGKKVVYETVDNNATDAEVVLDLSDGGNRSTAVYTSFVGGDTWLDLWKAAESVITQSKTHHKFIEDFTLNDDGTIELTTGS